MIFLLLLPLWSRGQDAKRLVHHIQRWVAAECLSHGPSIQRWVRRLGIEGAEPIGNQALADTLTLAA